MHARHRVQQAEKEHKKIKDECFQPSRVPFRKVSDAAVLLSGLQGFSGQEEQLLAV
jgi:hypothetical protein